METLKLKLKLKNKRPLDAAVGVGTVSVWTVLVFSWDVRRLKSSAGSQASSLFVSPLISSPGSRAGPAMSQRCLTTCAGGTVSLLYQGDLPPPGGRGQDRGVAPTGRLPEPAN